MDVPLLRTSPRAVLIPVLVAIGVGLTGCTTTPLSEVEPVVEEFAFAGDRVDVHQANVPTDLVVGDRDDIGVELRVSVLSGTPKDVSSTLEDGRLQLANPCPQLVICDVRYRVEVPPGVTVLREGRATDIKG